MNAPVLPDWLAAVPRLTLGHLPTPLEPLDRLSAELGGPRIWIKRDDCTGLATGGNKTRKLEYLLADARAAGATDILTFGAVQSNHARQTAAACARVGLPCHLILTEQVAWKHRHYSSGGNVLMDRLFGAEVHIVPVADAADVTQQLTERLTASGRHPYLIPAGGSNAVGAIGYVRCAVELANDFARLGIRPRNVVHASSSAGTQAGLLYGFARLDSHVSGVLDSHVPATRRETPVSVLGINVYHERPAELARRVQRIAEGLATRLGAADLPAPAITDRYRGRGYGIPTPAGVDAIRMLARLEGLIFDPVYSGKAVAALIDLVSVGQFSGEDDVVLIHTGGTASLAVYDNAFD
ncbi:MAG: D-cysteine desulfhydrase family protein [Pseudomonadales bacterium]|nr:D-cysteine desulfhydrase family protein [Pseudomonadales bacterium]MCP5183778.1 D-cysteine desulfhydrase family protein [Pseudomonadales bacterium]